MIKFSKLAMLDSTIGKGKDQDRSGLKGLDEMKRTNRSKIERLIGSESTICELTIVNVNGDGNVMTK